MQFDYENLNLCHILSSVGQDDDMDTSPLEQPLFMIDKGKGKGGSEDTHNEDDEDCGQDEDPNCPVEGNSEDDEEVSVTKKASANDRGSQNGEGARSNGRRHSESEESSDEEGLEEDERDEKTVEAVKCLPATFLTPQCQTSTS